MNEHQCPEDNGSIHIIEAKDTWVIYNDTQDEIVVTDIVFCPFCGKRLGGGTLNAGTGDTVSTGEGLGVVGD